MSVELATLNGQQADRNARNDSPLAVRGLTVSYGQKPAVFSVDMTVRAGAMTAIIGPNGAGKSTLLKAALGILQPLAGTVSVMGKTVADMRDSIAYVPQRASVDWDFPTRVIRKTPDRATVWRATTKGLSGARSCPRCRPVLAG